MRGEETNLGLSTIRANCSLTAVAGTTPAVLADISDDGGLGMCLLYRRLKRPERVEASNSYDRRQQASRLRPGIKVATPIYAEKCVSAWNKDHDWRGNRRAICAPIDTR